MKHVLWQWEIAENFVSRPFVKLTTFVSGNAVDMAVAMGRERYC